MQGKIFRGIKPDIFRFSFEFTKRRIKTYFEMKFMRLTITHLVISFLLIALPEFSRAQDFTAPSRVSGNFQLDAQYYRSDTLIGAPEVNEKMLMNAFTNILFTKGDFTAGLRFESYLNPISGYNPNLRGTGMPYRFISYRSGDFEITAGNFYEQFGNGLILRTYDDWNLGTDNSLDGVRVRYSPMQGIAIKGVYGKQRYFWDLSPGIVRGLDADFSLNDLLKPLNESSTRIFAGAGMVSKYQREEAIFHENQRLILPENVGAFAGRLNVSGMKFNFSGEYAYKINDPSSINNFIYKHGQSLYLNATYFQPGLSFLVSAKHTDNMSFKSRRTETSEALDINFLPPLTKQHTHSLSSMYPYATQPNGEVAYQGQAIYTIKRRTKIGGPYGTYITANYSIVHALNRRALNDTTAIGQRATSGYKASLFDAGDEKYFNDFNVEISRRMNRKLKISLQYINLFYNIAVIEGHPGYPDVKANIGIADIEYRITTMKAIRFVLEHLSTKQDNGDWAAAMVEYSIAPRWFFSISDQFNFGNPDKDKRLHYYNFSMGYSHHSSRIALNWGRQREGIICVGGVCRYVPASSGLMLTITSAF
jgi:hypothetical protein